MASKFLPNIGLPDGLKRFRLRLNDSRRFLILCIVAGVVCGLIGVSFHLAIATVFNSLWGAYAGLGLWAWPAMVLTPAAAGLVVGLLLRYVEPNAAGSGIPQTKAAYYQNDGVIRGAEAFWRFVAGTVSVGCGNSLGREGPTVHICSAVCSKIGRIVGLDRLRVQSMVPVGMGAGISAAFNAPISAITFVFEELLDDFSNTALGGILIAVVVAAVVERTILGEHGALQASEVEFATSWWMLVCLFLGPAAGFLGNFFVDSLLRLRGRFQQWKQMPSWLKPALGGLGAGMLGVVVLFFTSGHYGVFSIGYDDLNSALNGELTWLVLLLLLVGKMAATIVCYASGTSGGIFAPVMFIGSMLGGLFGVVLVGLFGADESVAAGAALLGTGAFFAAVIRCPITSILIIFEMTRNYSLILPLMVGNLIAYAVARRLRAVPIYDALLLQDGINLRKLPGYRGDQNWRNLPVETIMTHSVSTVLASLGAAENLERIAQQERRHRAYPIVEPDSGRVLGMVLHDELERMAAAGQTDPLGSAGAARQLIFLHPGRSISDAANLLLTNDMLQAPVVSPDEDFRLLGIITLNDIARQQNARDNA